MMKVYSGDYVSEDWNDDTYVITFYDENGEVTGQREYTADERAAADRRKADAEAIAQYVGLDQSIRDAIEHIDRIRQLAIEDQATAETLRQHAAGVSAQIATLLPQINAWVPGTTYRQSDMNVIKDQIKNITQRQKDIIDAMENMYVYRRENDIATATIYEAVLFMAQRLARHL